MRSLVHDLAVSEERLRGHEAADPRYRRQVLHHQARLIAELRTYHPPEPGSAVGGRPWG